MSRRAEVSAFAATSNRIFDDRGNRMSPSTAKKGSIRYGYYVSSVLAQGRRSDAGAIARVSASDVEAVVLDALRAAYPDDADREERAIIEARIERIVIGASTILMHPSSDLSEAIEVAWSPPAARGRREILASTDVDGEDRGIKAEARTVLLRSVALARQWLDDFVRGSTPDDIAARAGCTTRHVTNTIPLAFLAPDIVRAAVDARLPRGISSRSIVDPALEWSRQWDGLGIGRLAS